MKFNTGDAPRDLAVSIVDTLKADGFDATLSDDDSSPADDIGNPNWDDAGRVHDWRNYPSDRIKELWGTFTRDQQEALVEHFQETANGEEWD